MFLPVIMCTHQLTFPPHTTPPPSFLVGIKATETIGGLDTEAETQYNDNLHSSGLIHGLGFGPRLNASQCTQKFGQLERGKIRSL